MLAFVSTVAVKAGGVVRPPDPLVSIDLITGATARRQRREILDDLRVRRLDAVAAPRVLDEGVDVPDANLGIAAGHSLREALEGAGAEVRWLPFDGGHEIPPQAWLALRRLVREVAARGSPDG